MKVTSSPVVGDRFVDDFKKYDTTSLCYLNLQPSSVLCPVGIPGPLTGRTPGRRRKVCRHGLYLGGTEGFSPPPRRDTVVLPKLQGPRKERNVKNV